jgi:hypothetical protein
MLELFRRVLLRVGLHRTHETTPRIRHGREPLSTLLALADEPTTCSLRRDLSLLVHRLKDMQAPNYPIRHEKPDMSEK